MQDNSVRLSGNFTLKTRKLAGDDGTGTTGTNPDSALNSKNQPQVQTMEKSLHLEHSNMFGSVMEESVRDNLRTAPNSKRQTNISAQNVAQRRVLQPPQTRQEGRKKNFITPSGSKADNYSTLSPIKTNNNEDISTTLDPTGITWDELIKVQTEEAAKKDTTTL